ncbi:MAG: hypothetical protein A2937_02600 [Candidatus Yonathbacteria bacterium RIFCSPLOWO2_01_FULL_47_33b]|uniref:Uncharacterized protein n=1 Tax=Candidatus Yonathbacteria bacterium RIFCSPLOWO2_01_FULL_47_33b TaxID=1802727 RepID=A0A1G2SG91_9BACT|nr:MAG: hypothetical protein A2937_02600 [Candidatus Yonathbacteria bacterium RIFCSPLOWO2_01_FULL_47_33b]
MFLTFCDMFPRISQELQEELIEQIPQRVFAREEIGFFTLLLVRGVSINGCTCRVYFNEAFSPFDLLTIADFVNHYKDALMWFHQRVRILKINQQLKKPR